MRKILITLCLSLFLFGSNSSAEATVKEYRAGPFSQSRAQIAKKLKRVALTGCTALLTTTTGVSVYTTTLLTTNNKPPIFSLTVPTYRNRKVLHVFMAKGLGKKFMEHFDLKLEDGDLIETVVEERIDYEKAFERARTSWDEDTLSRSIILTKSDIPNELTGFIMLPGFLSRFTADFSDESVIKFKVYTLVDNFLVFTGEFKNLGPAEQSQPQ